MRPLLSPEEMGRADAAAIAAGTSAEVLMGRAGNVLARAAIAVAGGRYARRAAVVCGKGNNGGDGFAAARRLAREGVAVTCMTTFDVAETKGAARDHLDRLRTARVPVAPFDAERLRRADVVVDAVFGTGFRGRAKGAPAAAIEAINDAAEPTVAADIPSGVNGLTGAAEGPAVRATTTVAMAAEKYGTATSQGSVLAGRVEVADIGIAVPGVAMFMSERSDVARVLPVGLPDSHKRSRGAIALIAGSAGMTGAALLAARGAVRMGAGYATLGTTAAGEAAKSVVLPEVLSEVVSDGDSLGPDALRRFETVLGRADALAIGPGLGRGDEQRELITLSLAEVWLPIVLDADGLNALAGRTEPLERRSGATVITPHPAELARLVDSDVAEVQRDRIAAARSAAARFGCVVLLKGWRTVVARPDGGAVINPTGGAEMATAGTGDVLTGAIAALLAARLGPFEAAWAGAYVHGMAGSVAATRAGGGLLASEVAEALPRARSAICEADGTTVGA
ncbi:MAG: NAD(P)H-hydrate dehydratase [Actinomycetota bacterium]